MGNYNNAVNSKKHKVTFFEKIVSNDTGDAGEYTLDELFDDLLTLSSQSHDLRDFTDSQINYYKTYQAKSFVFAALDKGKRLNSAVLERTLLSIDIDQKLYNLVTIEQITSILNELNLDSILYTTISHSRSFHRCRIIIDAGCDCDEKLHNQLVDWFIGKLPDPSIVDHRSKVRSQAMILPVAYAHIPPIVERIKGESIYSQYKGEVDATAISDSNVSVSGRMMKNLVKEAIKYSHKENQLYQYQVGCLHKALILSRFTDNSTQYHRNTNDIHPALFSMNHMPVILDKAYNDRYELVYSRDDYSEALNHSLMTRSDVEIELLMWEMDNSYPYAIFRENCGSGKSATLAVLSSYDPLNQVRIFTFHTRDNRDSFAAKASNSVVIYGNAELIGQVVTDNVRFEKINEFLTKYYEENGSKILLHNNAISSGTDLAKSIAQKSITKFENKLFFKSVLNELCIQGHLSECEVENIIKLVRENNKLINSDKHLIMTTMKFELMASFSKEGLFDHYVIYTDEVTQGMLTHIPSSCDYQVYMNQNISILGTAPPTTVINRERLKSLKRCLITVESGILYELDKQGVAYKEISAPVNTYDPSLEIVLVPSTSNHYKNSRTNIAKVLGHAIGSKDAVIVDGEKKSGFNVNHTSSKGSNQYATNKIAVIISYPSPDELANTMHCTGLDELDAVRLIMSDKAIQSVGRNMGYRNRDVNGNPSMGNNHCLLVLPASQRDLYLQNVTSKVANTSKWISSNRSESTDESIKSQFYFRDVIDAIANVTKASNQTATTKPMTPQEFIHEVYDYAVTHGTNLVSLKVLKQITGLKQDVVKHYAYTYFDDVGRYKWMPDSDNRRESIRLNNPYEVV